MFYIYLSSILQTHYPQFLSSRTFRAYWNHIQFLSRRVQFLHSLQSTQWSRRYKLTSWWVFPWNLQTTSNSNEHKREAKDYCYLLRVPCFYTLPELSLLLNNMQPLVFAHVLTCIQMAFQTLATVLTYDPLLHLLLNIITYLGITDFNRHSFDIYTF